MNLGDGLAVPEHDNGFTAFDLVKERRRVRAKVSERDRFHASLLPPASM